jgi:hypothetical protein
MLASSTLRPLPLDGHSFHPNAESLLITSLSPSSSSSFSFL